MIGRKQANKKPSGVAWVRWIAPLLLVACGFGLFVQSSLPANLVPSPFLDESQQSGSSAVAAIPPTMTVTQRWLAAAAMALLMGGWHLSYAILHGARPSEAAAGDSENRFTTMRMPTSLRSRLAAQRRFTRRAHWEYDNAWQGWLRRGNPLFPFPASSKRGTAARSMRKKNRQGGTIWVWHLD